MRVQSPPHSIYHCCLSFWVTTKEQWTVGQKQGDHIGKNWKDTVSYSIKAQITLHADFAGCSQAVFFLKILYIMKIVRENSTDFLCCSFVLLLPSQIILQVLQNRADSMMLLKCALACLVELHPSKSKAISSGRHYLSKVNVAIRNINEEPMMYMWYV